MWFAPEETGGDSPKIDPIGNSLAKFLPQSRYAQLNPKGTSPAFLSRTIKMAGIKDRRQFFKSNLCVNNQLMRDG